MGLYLPIQDGRKTVAASATAEALVDTSTPCNYVEMTAETDNTGIIVVGGSTVVAALATRRGIPLSAGESMGFRIKDLQSVWLDTTINGDGVSYIYFAR